MELTVAQRRVGTDETSPESITLKAGALTADLVAGGLRTIRYQGREVLRAIAYVVRDKDWGTFLSRDQRFQLPSGRQSVHRDLPGALYQ